MIIMGETTKNRLIDKLRYIHVALSYIEKHLAEELGFERIADRQIRQ